MQTALDTPPPPPDYAFEPMPRDQLRGVERLAVPLLERLNRTRWLKTGVHAVIGTLDSLFVRFITGNLWEVHGVEHARIDADQGVILVSNHRSFFDMYICYSMLRFETKLGRRLFFPVRSGFFYDRVLGLLLNLVISGGSMWPPVFREEERRGLNRIGLRQMAAVLGPGGLIGIHPEGKRGKGPDPYELLPARAGLGRLIEVCHPETVVLPFFTLGLGNSFKQEVRRNFKKAGERGEPVRIRFAEGIRAGDLQRLEDAQAMTDAVMDVIKALGAEDKAARAADPRVA